MPRKSRKRARSGRKRGGQKGHKGATRKLMPLEQVKEVQDTKPDMCRRCGHKLAGEDSKPHRHQVTEIPPVIVEVTEYRLHNLACLGCGAETRAKLPVSVPQGAFGPRLQAMVSLLSGQYHLSKRETVEVMADFFQADVGLGSVPALEQRTSEAISAPVDEARQYVQKQPVAHLDTGVKIEFLASECESSLKGETTPDCRVRCLSCGILTTFKGSMPELECVTNFAQAPSVHTSHES